MLIRLLKSIREDHLSENPRTDIEFSSFDICSIIYRMPYAYHTADISHPLEMVKLCLDWLTAVFQNQEFQNSAQVVDDTRKIFDTSKKLPGLAVIAKDLHEVWAAACAEHHYGQSFISRAHLAA